MITNNWYNIFKYLPCYGIKSIPYVGYNGDAKTTSVSSVLYTYNDATMFNSLDDAGASNSSGVVFGSGATVPTVDDYKLGSSIIKNLATSSVLTQELDVNGAAVRTSVITITNNNTEDVTISEVGYVGRMSSSDSSASSSYALLDHTLLEEPITIPPEGVGQVTYTITINPPTF